MNDLEKEKMIKDLDDLRSNITALYHRVSMLSKRVNIIFDTLMGETNHSMYSRPRDDEGVLIKIEERSLINRLKNLIK